MRAGGHLGSPAFVRDDWELDVGQSDCPVHYLLTV